MADASSSELGASFSGSFLADKTDNEGELKLQEDSDDDANDCSNALHTRFFFYKNILNRAWLHVLNNYGF